MSTAYPPRLIKYAFSSKKERNAAATSASSMVSGNYGHFPDSFLLFYAGPGTDFLSQRFSIRENNEGLKKLYAVTYFKGPGTAQMTMYSTEDHSPPTLAISASEKRFGSSIRVTAPPPPASPGSAGQYVEIKYNFRRKTHSFAVVTPRGATADSNKGIDIKPSYVESHFEWREEARIKPKVRRLVKLAQLETGEPEELVATWKEGTVPSSQGRLAAFEFTNPATKARMGEYAALVGISSVLAICAIMGAGVDGAAAWQQEKALEKGYHDGYWDEEGSRPVYETHAANSWSDPWMKAGANKEDL